MENTIIKEIVELLNIDHALVFDWTPIFSLTQVMYKMVKDELSYGTDFFINFNDGSTQKIKFPDELRACDVAFIMEATKTMNLSWRVYCLNCKKDLEARVNLPRNRRICGLCSGRYI